MKEEEVAELINRRRYQILVHSCMYYRFDINLIEDSKFDKWCNELIELQQKYPEVAKGVKWHNEFKKLTHASGFDLPYSSPEVLSRAVHLLRYKGYDVSY